MAVNYTNQTNWTQHPYYTHPLYGWVNQLGRQTQLHINGMVQFNMPLIQQILPYREQTVPYLHQFLSQARTIPQFVEGIYTAELLAENGVKGIEQLYPVTSKWNTNPDPIVQIYLAGLYREMNIPTTFGPMMATLINQSINRYPMQSSPTYNITEEVGGTILQQIADRTANQVIKQLKSFTSQQVPQNNPTHPSQLNRMA